MNIFNHVYKALFKPGDYFSSNSSLAEELNSKIPYKRFVIILLACAIFLVGTRLVRENSEFAGIKVKVASGMEAKIEQNRREYSEQNTFEKILFAKVSYVVMWLLIPVLVTGLRFVFLKILGDNQGDFWDLLKLTLSTILPILFVTFLISIHYDFLPLLSWSTNSSGLMIAIGVNSILFAIGYLWEGRLCVAAFKNFYRQNLGRAILTWLFPGLLALNLLAILIIWNTWAG